jgi:hypothetical protein
MSDIVVFPSGGGAVDSVNGQMGEVVLDLSGDVSSVAGRTGDVTLARADVSGIGGGYVVFQKNATQVIATGTETAINWGASMAEDTTGKNWLDATLSNIVIPSGVSRVRLNWHIQKTGYNVCYESSLVKINGSAPTLRTGFADGNFGSVARSYACGSLAVSPGDVLTITAYQESGGNVTLSTDSWVHLEVLA